MRSYVLPLCAALALLSTPANAIIGANPRVEAFPPDPCLGERVASDSRLLPRGVSGLLPENAGEPFYLEVEPGLYAAEDERTVRALLDEILPATGFLLDSEALVLADKTGEPAADPDEVAAVRRADTAALQERLERRLGRLSDETLRAIELQADEAEVLVSQEITILRFQQSIDGLPLSGMGVNVSVDQDGSVISVTGALLNVRETDNRVRLSGEDAASVAREWLGRSIDVTSLSDPELGAQAVGTGVLATWTVEADTTEGPYRVLVDAESGDVLSVESLVDAIKDGEGLTWHPDPDAVTAVSYFEVNDAVGNKFVLANDQITSVENLGGGGCDTTTLSVSAAGGYANFNVAPINGTVVEDVTMPGYNCRFQDVDVYARVMEAIYWFQGWGALDLDPFKVRVGGTNICGSSGPDNACAGGGLTFGIGSATLDPVTGSWYNFGLDETVFVHELGHRQTATQLKASAGGKQSGSVGEGLADYWSAAVLNTDMIGPWTGKKSAAPTQAGNALPRQIESADVFPEHFALSGGSEGHANGQMIAWAQWSFRKEMADRSPIGAGLASRILMDALTHAGFITSTDPDHKSVYLSFQDILAAELLAAGNSPARADLLQGFARAGIFITTKETVIDISDDWLQSSDAPPTFTVWTGQDFAFNAAGAASDSNQYNDSYEVELANDADFTVNHISSGTQTNVAEDSTGNSYGTWTPSAKQWATLTGGKVLYYRARSWDPGNTTPRDSEHTMAGFMEVPTTAAMINDGGSASCSSVGAKGGLLGLLGALGLALSRRRRS